MTNPHPTTRSRVFATTAGLAAGYTPKQLRGPTVTRVLRGVYTTDDAADPLVKATAALLAAGADAHVCEVTALLLGGVELPPRFMTDGEPTHLHVPVGRCGPQRPGIRVHHTDVQMPVGQVAGVPSMHLAECWLQLAARATLSELVSAGDGLMRRPRPPLWQPFLVTPDELAAAVATSHRRRGIRLARCAVALVRPGTDSPMESVTRFQLVRAGLPVPCVNYPVLDATDRPIFFLDMAYPEQHVAVEYDGAVHVGNGQQMGADAARRRRLEDAGWRVITATAHDLADSMSGIVASVRRELLARGDLKAIRLAPESPLTYDSAPSSRRVEGRQAIGER